MSTMLVEPPSTTEQKPMPELVAPLEPKRSGKLAIKVENVSRTYNIKVDKKAKKEGKASTLLTALGGVSLEVEEGELFGLLGPNGAGKTTLIKIMTTLLAPSGGVAYVDGLDVVKDSQEVRRRINMVSGGETSGYGILTVRENLWVWSQFYGLDSKVAYQRIDDLLKIVELEDKGSAMVSSLSTGQRQRMNFCRGFVTDPKILFLDEPTLGLDVHAARIVREYTQQWMRDYPDRTVLLTTHYMAEADQMCDRIAIIDSGKVLALDTPANLKKLLQKEPIFEIAVGGLHPRSLEALQRVPGVVRLISEEQDGGVGYNLKFIIETESVIGAVVSEITTLGGSIQNLQKNEPTLEDVFIKLVGRSLSGGEKE